MALTRAQMEEARREGIAKRELEQLKAEIERDKQAETRKQLYKERCRVFGLDKANEMEERERAIARITGES